MEYTTAGPSGDKSNFTLTSRSSASSPGLLGGQFQQDSPTTDAAAPPAKRRRIRTEEPNGHGCLNCRARKVKCPGKPENGGACKACLKFNFDCNFEKGGDGPARVVRVAPSIHRTEAGTPRARAPKACNECHAHKTRCTSEHPQCRRCKSLNIKCVYEKSKRKPSSASGSRSTATPKAADAPSRSLVASSAEQTPEVQQSIEPYQLVSPSASMSSLAVRNRRSSLGHNIMVEDILVRKNIVIRHFRMWFKTWARCPLVNFLHEKSTYIEIEENRLNQNIGKIVCAITTRFLNPGMKRLPSFAEMCAEDVERYISQHMGTFLKERSRDNLILLVITIGQFWAEHEMGKVWMLMGIAGRMITALQLNWDGAGEGSFEQESIRRVVWKLWLIDRLLAGGFDEHLTLRDEFMHLSRPVHDADIPDNDEMAVTTSTPASRSWPPGTRLDGLPPLCVFHIDLHRMKHHILFVTKNLTTSPTPHPRPRVELSQVLESINQLQCQLFHFHQSLPECLKVSDAIIRQWAMSPECGSFVMMYTTFCELHIDLYRFSIPGLREEADPEIARKLPREFVEQSQNQAVGYAVSLSRFWQSVQEHVSRRPVDGGVEKLLTCDGILILSIIQCTKVLLAARKHMLFAHLREDSSAPLVREIPVTDDGLAALIQSNMALFDAFTYIYPGLVETYTRDLRAAVENFQKGMPYDNPRQTIGMPARKPPHNVRLPGPHYMLEQAIAPPDEEHRAVHRNKSGADVLFRQKTKASNDAALTPSTSGLHSQEEAANAEKPDIPVWLATARAREAFGTISSTPTTIPQQSPQTPFSPYQNQLGQPEPGTPAVPHPVSSASPFSYQPQWAHYNPMPMITDPVSGGPLSPYAQHAGQHMQSVPGKQHFLSTTVRSSPWRPEGGPPSEQSSPQNSANFSQPSLSAPPYQYSNQPLGQYLPSTSAHLSQQPSSLQPSSYQNHLSERSSLEQQSPDTQAIIDSQLPQNYWPHQPQPPTPFDLPVMAPNPPTDRPPSIPPYDLDQAQGAEASATLPQLPFPVTGTREPRTLSVTPGYYVRAAGTLQKYPADLVHP